MDKTTMQMYWEMDGLAEEFWRLVTYYENGSPEDVTGLHEYFTSLCEAIEKYGSNIKLYTTMELWGVDVDLYYPL